MYLFVLKREICFSELTKSLVHLLFLRPKAEVAKEEDIVSLTRSATSAPIRKYSRPKTKSNTKENKNTQVCQPHFNIWCIIDHHWQSSECSLSLRVWDTCYGRHELFECLLISLMKIIWSYQLILNSCIDNFHIPNKFQFWYSVLLPKWNDIHLCFRPSR